MKKKTHQSKSNSDLPKIRKVGSIDNPKDAVIFGKPGTGKTTLACDWPGKKLLIDMNDKGTDSVEDLKDVEVAQCNKWTQVDALYWALKEEDIEYDTVILDTTTGLQQLCIEEVTGEKESLTFGSLTRRQFGEVSSMMKDMLTNFRDLDMNVIFLAQERLSNDEDEANNDEVVPEIGPAMMPSIATAMCASVGIVVRTFIRKKTEKKEVGKKVIKKEKMQYCLNVGPNPVILTKIRKPKSVVLPGVLVNPTYEDLMTTIKGED